MSDPAVPIRTARPADLRIVVCGAGPAVRTPELVREAVARGWTVDVTATAAALSMIDAAGIGALSGRPVRTTYGYGPDGARVSPAADALIVAPATFNTINKLALGIADTYPLSSVAEVIGRGVPTVIVPAVNAPLSARRPYREAVEALQAEGVRFAADGTAALAGLRLP
ncbi:flavoprotein [Actinoplanes sp. N902-109]|uniref:flavoprotein n=1 Tax=Actinoplanes sp. (strain N902-109) TaxID=649831 RepID=UPI0003295E18|nr:flavoprotein [Actinoplanes sp. N902-109]AGL15223.1 flavoprotein [Actinoplanes sp. N902-109]